MGPEPAGHVDPSRDVVGEVHPIDLLSQFAQVVALGFVELKRPRQRLDDRRAGAPFFSALEADVVVVPDSGQRGELLAS